MPCVGQHGPRLVPYSFCRPRGRAPHHGASHTQVGCPPPGTLLFRNYLPCPTSHSASSVCVALTFDPPRHDFLASCSPLTEPKMGHALFCSWLVQAQVPVTFTNTQTLKVSLQAPGIENREFSESIFPLQGNPPFRLLGILSLLKVSFHQETQSLDAPKRGPGSAACSRDSLPMLSYCRGHSNWNLSKSPDYLPGENAALALQVLCPPTPCTLHEGQFVKSPTPVSLPRNQVGCLSPRTPLPAPGWE